MKYILSLFLLIFMQNLDDPNSAKIYNNSNSYYTIYANGEIIHLEPYSYCKAPESKDYLDLYLTELADLGSPVIILHGYMRLEREDGHYFLEEKSEIPLWFTNNTQVSLLIEYHKFAAYVDPNESIELVNPYIGVNKKIKLIISRLNEKENLTLLNDGPLDVVFHNYGGEVIYNLD